MLVLITVSAVRWYHLGNSQIRENWNVRQGSSPSTIAHDIFNGVCIGMLGLTGFECALRRLICYAFSHTQYSNPSLHYEN
jgi:hypothetical protein